MKSQEKLVSHSGSFGKNCIYRHFLDNFQPTSGRPPELPGQKLVSHPEFGQLLVKLSTTFVKENPPTAPDYFPCFSCTVFGCATTLASNHHESILSFRS